MKVLLISPNTLTTPYPVYPLGLDYVAGCLEDRHRVEIVDLNVCTLEELEETLVRFVPEVIGLSCRNIDNTEVGDPRFFVREHQRIMTWLRKRSEAPVVLGGSGFTIMPHAILEALEADYGIIGEGERFAQLVGALERGEDPAGLPGVITPATAYEAASPEPWQGERRQRIERTSGHRGFYLARGGMLNLQTKRGCSFNCVYCPYPAIEGRKHRLVEPELVAKTAVELQEAGAQYLFITDSAFNSDIEHSLAVARSFKTHGLAIPWGGFFAPVKLPQGYFEEMAAAGLKHAEFGTESLSAAMLKNYRKPFTVADVVTAHRMALDAGVHAAHYFLLGGPGESEETVRETLDTIERLEKTVLFFFFGIRIYPQTGLHDIALREGKISGVTDLLEPLFYESDAIDHQRIEALVRERVGERRNCIIGSGGSTSGAIIAKMHEKGYVGPLWEYLIR